MSGEIFFGTFCLKYLTELACFICVCILCGLSRKNPFESHTIGDLSKYFVDAPKNSTNSTNIITTKYMNTKNNFRLLKRYDKLYSKAEIQKKLNLRHLVSRSFCDEIREDFVNFKGKKLSNIFDLNYKKIRGISIANLVISCVMGFLNLLMIAGRKNDSFIVGMAILILILYEARFVISLVLFYYIGKSDIEKYDDFLECDNVRENAFDQFSDVNKLRKCFLAFLVLNIIVQGIDKIEKCFEYGEKLNK